MAKSLNGFAALIAAVKATQGAALYSQAWFTVKVDSAEFWAILANKINAL